MKFTIYATLLAGALLALTAARGETVAHWNFEDGEAGKPFAIDTDANTGSRDIVGKVLMHGYDNHAGPSFSSDSLYYNGLCLRAADNHQDGYVMDGPLMSWAPEAWTIECIVRMDKIAEWNTFIGRDGSSAGEQPADFYLQYSGAHNCFSLKFRTTGGQFVVIDATDLIAKEGQWYGLAAVSDGTKVSLYVDDRDGKGYQLEGTASLTDTDAANNALAGSKLTWIFGRGWYDGRPVDHINGYIDNIRFSDTALKPSELIPVPGDPFEITHSREELFTYMPQRIEVQIADAESEFRSAELFVDDTLVATNKARSGNRNSVSHTSTELAPGTHNARVVVEGINPPVTITKSWTFEVQKAPVDFVAEGATPGQWTMDLEAAKRVAAEKRLPILLNFSGSDWIDTCKLMETNVFTKPEWQKYAKDHLMMVLIDFPRNKKLVPEKYVQRNQDLRRHYRVGGYPTFVNPTFVILDDDGETELGRLGAGYDSTPESFQAELEKLFSLHREIDAYIARIGLQDQAAVGNDSPSAIVSLQKERVDTLKKCIAVLTDRYTLGISDISEVSWVTKELTDAGSSDASTKKARREILRESLKLCMLIEELIKNRRNAGFASDVDVLLTHANRLKAEIALLREGGDDVTELQKKQIDALKELVARNRDRYCMGIASYSSILWYQKELYEAELSAATTKEYRIEILRKSREVCVSTEELFKNQRDAGLASEAEVLGARGSRLKVEIALFQESGKDVSKLQTERVDTLKQCIASLTARYKEGLASSMELVQATNELTDAGSSDASTKKARREILRESLKLCMLIEELIKTQMDASLASDADVLLTHANRLKAEIALLREGGPKDD